jgi:PTS system nitrogen regulatory IIA component
MDLTVRDVADTLQVSENTVYRWVNEKNLPAQQVNGQYRFNRVQLLEWAALHHVEMGPGAFRPGGPGTALPRLDDALRAGQVIEGLPGADKPGVLRALVEALNLPPGLDRDDLLQLFLGRESLGSTGIGGGIALPHPRYPIVNPGRPPSVSICYLAQAIDFGALDRRPVHTLFTLLSPTPRAHLHVLSRLLYALRDPAFRDAIGRKAPAAEIIGQAGRLEEAFARQPPPGVPDTD